MTNSYAWLQKLLLCGFTLFASTPAIAQITPDNTLGAESSRFTPNVTINGAEADRIDGGATRGSNLFHSFSEFNIDDGQRVYFGNPTGIQNILTRVTGGNASNILGTLGVDGAANLFLINPNGIIFGQNAFLDVRGSFVGTTANGIGFGEQGFFSATDTTAPPLLTVNPSALLFNQIAIAPIQNNSIAPAGLDPAGFQARGLRVPNGKSLLLVGGDISMNGGRLNAFGGRVELGGLASSGTVGLEVDGNNLSLSLPDQATRASVSLTNRAGVDVTAAGGGSIAVNAQNLSVSGRSTLFAGIGQGLGSDGAVAGNITLDAKGEIEVVESAIFNVVQSQAVGDGGNINVITDLLSLTDGALLQTSTLGQGNAGNVLVQAKDSVFVTGSSNILTGVSTGAMGNAGNINVTTSSLSLTDGAGLYASTRGKGDAGSVSVRASDFVSLRGIGSVIFSNVESGAEGIGGNINITAASLSLTDGAQLATGVREASNNQPAGKGNAGNVNVDVTDTVTIAGGKDRFASGILSYLGTEAIGKAGNITISAGSLFLTDGAQLSANTSGKGDAGNVTIAARNRVSFDGVTANGQLPSAAFSNVEATGDGRGGDVRISTGSLSLTNGAQLQASILGQGTAGNVIINARDAVLLDGTSSDGRFTSDIFSEVAEDARGDGGNIEITTSSLSVTNGAALVARTLGQGKAGNIIIRASDRIVFDGTGANGINQSGALSNVGKNAIGTGGNIEITTGSFSLTNGAQLQASILGQGTAGNVIINARDAVLLDGTSSDGRFTSDIFSEVAEDARGDGGNIEITTSSLSVTNGAALVARTLGQGKAGNIIIRASDRIVFDGTGANGINQSGALSNVGKNAIGTGGNIEITTGSFSLTNGGLLSAGTRGFGDAGSVLVQAKDSVSAASNSVIISSVGSGSVGNGGNINITTPTLSLSDGSGLVTSVLESSNNQPAGEGIAGNVFVDVSGSVTISGVNNEFTSGIFSRLETGAKGKGGNVNLKTGSLSITDGAQIDASTFGIGDAGNVEIVATQPITVAGTGNDARSSAIFTTTGDNPTITGKVGTGKGGNITITAPALKVSEGGVIDARTFNDQPGGDINLTLGTLQLLNGAQIFTTSESSGAAGTIAINANQGVTIAGNDTTYFSRLNQFPNRIVQISPNSSISVRSIATGAAGNINLNTPQLVLDNQGTINAQSNAVDGGNITINSDLLLLRRNSSISATAGLTSGAGNGGNITIDADFIIAVPNENSDITANAFSGRGGNVDIITQGIFGIQQRSSLTNLSDITASSAQNVQGQIDITEPNVQPTQGLVELPGQILDASNQIAQSCPNGSTANRPLGEFVVTGRGSLPPNPLELLAGTTSLSPLASIEGDPEANTSVQTSSPAAISTTPATIVEAQGWVKTADGKIALVASAPSATPNASTRGATCPVSK